MSTKNLIPPAVAAAVFNDEGDVLLQKRKDVNKKVILNDPVHPRFKIYFRI
jgi:hypothetical protein